MTGKPAIIITGASAGMGEATVRLLCAEGYRVLAGARRVDKLEALAQETGCWVYPLDVTDADSVAAFFAHAATLPVSFQALVNNAGAGIGFDHVKDSDPDSWTAMFDVNVVGTLRMTQAFLAQTAPDAMATLVQIGSIAGLEAYPGGGGYVAAKHAMHAMTDLLRVEEVGKSLRVTMIAPGLTESEFVKNRAGGDAGCEAAVFQGVNGVLVPEDISEAVAWIIGRPDHVNIDLMVIKPRVQASANLMWRE